MKNALYILLCFAFAAHAATTTPTKNVTQEVTSKKLTDSLVVPSGASITINSGASIINNGTATGFGGGGGGSGTVTSVNASVPTFLSVAGVPITTSGTISISLSGTALPVANGGTGGTTASAARSALGLAIGTDVQAWSGKLDTLATGFQAIVPAPGYPVIWTGSTYQVSGALGANAGGTGISNVAIGDVIYGSATNTWSVLAGNTSASLKILTQTGNGSTSAAPVWTTGSSLKTSLSLNLVENTALSTWAGSTSLTTLGANAVTSSNITDGAIVNADINASAAIALSKLAVDPLARANHTGTQDWSTITGTPTTLAGYGIADAITAATASATYQPLSSNLTTYAGITPAANVQSLLGAANYTAMRSLLGLVINTNVQAYDGDLTTWSGLTPSSNFQTFLNGSTFSGMRSALGVAIGSNVQAYDADLTTYAGITPSANVQTLLGAADFAAFKTSLSLGTLADLSAITTTQITDGTIVNADISASAAIALSKLATDPLARANHTGTQLLSTISDAGSLAALSSVTSAYITDGTIVNADISSSAAIAVSKLAPLPVEIVVACSDETTALTTGTAKVTFRMPHAMTLTSVRLNVNTAPTGSVIIVDVKEAGTTIFSTKPQIATSAFTSVGGAVPGTISDSSLADDAEITINLDQIGSTIAGKGLKVTLVGTRVP
jgi:hypothetical protein